MKSWVASIFSPKIRSKLTYIYLIDMFTVSVKVAYNMEIVKEAKLSNIYGEYSSSDSA